MAKLPSNRSGLTQRSALGLADALDVNIDSMLCNLNSAFNPLHRDCLLNYHVQAINNSQVCMSVVMPNEMLRSFSTLLESMGGFFRVVNNKARASSAVIKTHDLDQIAEREQIRKAFNSEVCSVFDQYISEGFSMKEAVKRTNLTLKAQNNPWANSYIVERTLRSEGRLRKSRVKKEVNCQTPII